VKPNNGPQQGPGAEPKAETLGFWTFNGSRKFAHFSKIGSAKK